MLHGNIQVNMHTIGEWKAVRKEEVFPDDAAGPAPYYRYECVLEYRDMSGYPMRAEFDVVHRYGAGAMLLASRVISKGYDKAKRVVNNE